ncbi:response regulator [Coleofasciculus sp. FACHB-64]|jgi:CheY-like chemotaxis protein|uniref:response regulator n=1 Tax=Cyanophyceae TaxID=3028117 RepID=UPI001681E95A|nr:MULTISPECIES: response regulator [unclassified Coleofasciculus]MBD1836949.1 response regulator [Coleofasciculus sp. FACHB-501]MBD1877270.1 response regulator [Coleofasciculus sp. FACHB-T130]MBD1891887.1 response regulator [Coleofasciculus sp. FACHB-SPT9]MBD1941772.1 response regulator [Coleofasciculus sp. FACHB-712]MBD2049171.1 response regulator [Coleofasciculus sp. FACHB-64]
MTTPSLTRILLVEDDPDIQTVACLGLKVVGGFTVEVCSSGSEAIQKAPIFAPDLILLDVMMPGMDGMTTLKALRELPQTLSTPVIFLTAKVQTHEVAYYKQLGVLDVIAKPFDPMTLSATLNRMWFQYHD